VARRVVLVLLVASAGSALWASPAAAGFVDFDTGRFAATINNFTPYTMKLVSSGAPSVSPGSQNNKCGNICWDQAPAATIQAGERMVYQIDPYYFATAGFTTNSANFDAWMTYRVDLLRGPPEYVTVAILGQTTVDNNNNVISPAGLGVFITSAPPQAGYDPDTNVTPAVPQIQNPQLGDAPNRPYIYDQTFFTPGQFTYDAGGSVGSPFDDLLNGICGQVGTDTQLPDTTCSFKQESPIEWKLEDPPTRVATAINCTVNPGSQAPGARAAQDEPPPATDPNWNEVDYEATQSASLTVGGSVTVGTELNLFNTISGKISVKVEGEHEWTDLHSFKRGVKAYIPSNNVAFVWMAREIGAVTGTLTVSTTWTNPGPDPEAPVTLTWTILNFAQVRSGVTRNDLTPAFNAVTETRPLTEAEFDEHCKQSSLTKGLAPPPGAKRPARLVPGRGVEARLVPGRGVATVSLGETQARVLRHRGQPSLKRFRLHPCQGLERGCYAVRHLGSTWFYRHLRVVFGPDRRVSGLIHTGSQLTSKGVGVGSGMSAVRAAHPGVSCTVAASKRKRNCTLRRDVAGGAVKTVFRFTRTRTLRYKCDRVAIYFLPGPRSPGV
jgi:hypothetical protein